MAVYAVTGYSLTPLTLASNDDAVITQSGTLFSDNSSAITTNGNADITILGAVISDDFTPSAAAEQREG